MCYIIFWVIFTISFVIVKILYESNPNITYIDNVFSKAIVGVVAYYFMAKKDKIDLFNIPKEALKFMAIRALFGLTSMTLLMYGIHYCSVSLSTMISNISPFFISILGYVFLKESMSLTEIILMFVGFIGIYITWMDRKQTAHDEHLLRGVVALIISSITVSCAMVCVRFVNKIVHPMVSPFYQFIAINIYWIVVIWIWPDYIPKVDTYSLFEWTLLFIGTITGFTSQYLLSYAYKYEKAPKLAPYQYLQVVLGIVADIAIFNLTFTFTQILGMTIISASLIIPALMKYYQASK